MGRHVTSADAAVMRPSCVLVFGVLFLFGGNAAVFAAVAIALATGLTRFKRRLAIVPLLVSLTTTAAAAEAAALAADALGSTPGRFDWPWHGVPVAGAALAFAVATALVHDLVVPLATRHRIDPVWPARLLRAIPSYVVGASVAAALATAVEHQAWQVLAIAVVPASLAFTMYTDYVGRLAHERRRQQVIDFLEEGMAVVNGLGVVTLWDEGLERLLGCPRSRAVGRSLVGAVPALGDTELRRVVDEAMTSGARRAVTVALASGGGQRLLNVNVVPIDGGATLLWRDVTERAQAERGLKRSEERLSLAAEAANDGLWEWDLRTQEFYASTFGFDACTRTTPLD
jgi:PAS domain S-box-containing protein